MKMIPAVLLLVGFAMLWHAMLRDAKDSFDDGSFLIQLVEMIGGAAMVVVAVIWFAVLLFMAL